MRAHAVDIVYYSVLGRVPAADNTWQTQMPIHILTSSPQDYHATPARVPIITMHCGPRGCSRRYQLYEHLFCMFWASNYRPTTGHNLVRSDLDFWLSTVRPSKSGSKSCQTWPFLFSKYSYQELVCTRTSGWLYPCVNIHMIIAW